MRASPTSRVFGYPLGTEHCTECCAEWRSFTGHASSCEDMPKSFYQSQTPKWSSGNAPQSHFLSEGMCYFYTSSILVSVTCITTIFKTVQNQPCFKELCWLGPWHACTRRGPPGTHTGRLKILVQLVPWDDAQGTFSGTHRGLGKQKCL